MKKDFSQPFIYAPEVEVSLFICTEDDKFVLMKQTRESLKDEYAPMSFTVDTNEDLTREIGRHLYENGFLIQSLRELLREEDFEYGFIDDTAGTITTTKVFLVKVIVVERSNDFIYTTLAESRRLIEESPLVDTVDLAAQKLI